MFIIGETGNKGKDKNFLGFFNILPHKRGELTHTQQEPRAGHPGLGNNGPSGLLGIWSINGLDP